MGIRIFVDDNREFPKGFECFKSFGGVIMLMKYMNDDIDMISLDFDLGDRYTGLDILKWMKENGKAPKHINIHSDHEQGVPLMKAYAVRNFPDSVLTVNSV